MILAMCDRLGVHTTPVFLRPGVVVVPLQSWYKPTFGALLAERATPRATEAEDVEPETADMEPVVPQQSGGLRGARLGRRAAAVEVRRAVRL